MVLLQPKLTLRLTQRQILTPGLVQMVSVLALNKLELKDMITAEMVENPVLEELESTVPLLDEVASKQEERDRPQSADEPIVATEKDPFEEIDFGSFFQDYLDPGYRSPASEVVEKPSFENFLSRPSTLTDHLLWQLGSLSVRRQVREAAELVIGNLDEDGYLLATDEELLGTVPPAPPDPEAEARAAALREIELRDAALAAPGNGEALESELAAALAMATEAEVELALAEPASEPEPARVPECKVLQFPKPSFTREDLHEAIQFVRQMDPVGVAARDLRECLLAQLYYQQQLRQEHNANGELAQVLSDAAAIVNGHLRQLQTKQYREVAKAIGRPMEAVTAAVEFIKS